MEKLIMQQGLLIKDFKQFVNQQSNRIADNAERWAEHSQVKSIYLQSRIRKEQLAKQIAQEDGITNGPVCLMRRVEPVLSYRMVGGEKRPRLIRTRRQCLCYYFYVIDPVFGFMHARIESWFPMTIQVCMNGHDWLARKLNEAGIRFHQYENAFLSIDDPIKAQQIADRISLVRWPQTLNRIAAIVNPLLDNTLTTRRYYWCIEQAELATDVMFRSPEALADLYPQLLHHAIRCFSAEDVMTFLGRKMHGRFIGEVISDYKEKRWPGARIKHQMKRNWIKMYDKFGQVLRVETVINQSKEFHVRREGIRQGELVKGWFPMRKGVSSMGRYREVGTASNDRYLERLSQVPDRAELNRRFRRLAEPARDDRGRSYRGFNPASESDMQLFAAVMRGEHVLHGFRNSDIRERCEEQSEDPVAIRRSRHRVGRQLRRLHIHGLIAKIPRSRRWRVTKQGHQLMKASLLHHHETYPDTLAKLAA